MDAGKEKPWWRQLISGGDESKRFILTLLLGVLAVQLGFSTVSMGVASILVAFGGYYFILGVFAAFAVIGWKMASEHRAGLLAGLRRPGWPGLCIVGCSLFLILTDGFGHKILWDEYVLQSTAEHLHLTKQIGAAYRGFYIEGSWISFDIFLDKRPYFFTFLVSLLHDLTGYRPANMLILNAALVPVLLSLVYFCGRALSDRRGGVLAVLLLSSLPIMVQNASGSGMEIHNLTMLTLELCAGFWYLQRPDARSLSFLCLCTVLLSQSRYESVVFVAPAALVILIGWQRAGRPLLPWTLILLPLLFMPYAWHNRVLTANPILWQLHEGQSVRFSLNYLPANMEGLLRYFFVANRELAASVFVSVLGTLSLGFLFAHAWRNHRHTTLIEARPARISTTAFAFGIVINMSLLMFYYWARLDDPVASRFSLPSYLFLCLASALGVHEVGRFWRYAWPVTLAGLALYTVAVGLPQIHWKLYSEYNLVSRVLDWEMQEIASMPAKPRLLVCNRSNLPFMLRRLSAVAIETARKRADRIQYHLEQGTFQEVLVLQRFRATSAAGEFGLDPEDIMPEGLKLERVTERRFGASMHRISRLVGIDPKRLQEPEFSKAKRVTKESLHDTLGK